MSPAVVARHQKAMLALSYLVLLFLVANFAPVITLEAPPSAWMVALVILPQMSSHLSHTSDVSILRLRFGLCVEWLSLLNRLRLAIDNLLRTIVQPVLLPLGTTAGLPGHATDVAELIPADAGHMVAPIVQLDKPATYASAPPFSLCSLCELLQCCVSGTVSVMARCLTHGASCFVACPTRCDVAFDSVGWYERSTSRLMAICSIGSAELDRLVTELC